MDLDKLYLASQRPDIYEKGDAVMWTDDHISRKLLEIHLNPDVNSASRMPESIDKTLDFISSFCSDAPMRILDLGCGPGLYLESLAGSGHHCTGIDFSRNTIAYAANEAKKKNLNIEYLCQDYLELDFVDQFDLIILIYTDLGVLLPDEREGLLDKIHRALKPGGIFIFDVLNQKNLDKKFQEDQTWTFEFGGFWLPEPYLELASGFHYPEAQVFLMQHIIIDEADRIRNYRFWTHYFNTDDIVKMLSSSGFKLTRNFENILPSNDNWDGENVTFYKTQK